MAELTWQRPFAHRLAVLTLLGAGATLGGLLVAKGNAADSPPRYRFKPGQVLNYKGASEFKYGKKGEQSLGSKSESTVWVTRKNDDGSHHVVIQSALTSVYDGKAMGKPRTTLAWCDIFDDGRIVSNSTLGYRLDPTHMFPRLPADAPQSAKSWEDVRDDGRSTFTAKSPAGAASFVFDESRSSPMDEVYLSTHTNKITFDPQRGFVTNVKSENTQSYGFDGKGTGTTDLVSIKDDPKTTAQLSEQANGYFEADRAYTEALRRASKNLKATKEVFEKISEILKAETSKVTVPLLKSRLDEQLKQHPQMAEYYLEEAKERGKKIGSPAKDWQARDLEGKDHSLKDYRGKVVVLDFWYRGCGWCIRAMPQMKLLAAEFQKQPVAVLGMNTDSNPADARFVADKLKLNYTNVRIESTLPKEYGVQGFPTLVIIDQNGKIHDVHVGYSPTLQQNVGDVIRELLAKK